VRNWWGILREDGGTCAASSDNVELCQCANLPAKIPAGGFCKIVHNKKPSADSWFCEDEGSSGTFRCNFDFGADASPRPPIPCGELSFSGGLPDQCVEGGKGRATLADGAVWDKGVYICVSKGPLLLRIDRQ
jgi:hypothetical protein